MYNTHHSVLLSLSFGVCVCIFVSYGRDHNSRLPVGPWMKSGAVCTGRYSPVNARPLVTRCVCVCTSLTKASGFVTYLDLSRHEQAQFKVLCQSGTYCYTSQHTDTKSVEEERQHGVHGPWKVVIITCISNYSRHHNLSYTYVRGHKHIWQWLYTKY